MEYGTHETLDTTTTQNSPPSSTTWTETSQTTTSQLHHDHDHVLISTTSTISEHIFTGIATALRQCDKRITEDQHTKLLWVEPNVKKPLQIFTSTQLQHEGIQDQEHIITIQHENSSVIGHITALLNKTGVAWLCWTWCVSGDLSMWDLWVDRL